MLSLSEWAVVPRAFRSSGLLLVDGLFHRRSVLPGGCLLMDCKALDMNETVKRRSRNSVFGALKQTN